MFPAEAPRLTTWVTASEIAEELGVSRQTANTMIHNGEFKTLHRMGISDAKPQYVVKRSELAKVAETREFPRRKDRYAPEDVPLIEFPPLIEAEHEVKITEV